MKVEGIVFAILAVFFAITTPVYGFWSKDPTGTVALGICTGLGLLIGGYLLFTSRRIEPRPQDLPDAEVSDGAGEIGHFSPRSYWPFFIALGAALATAGVAFGVWLMLLGGALTFGSVCGLLFEQYVNKFSPERS